VNMNGLDSDNPCKLEEINLANNKLGDVNELLKLQSCQQIESLNVVGNPICAVDKS